MNFLIQPVADLTGPLYRIACGEPSKRQEETEKFILAVLRTGLAAIVFFSARQSFMAKNKSAAILSWLFTLALAYVHNYSGLLGVINWYAFMGTRSEIFTQRLWLGKAIDMTFVITGLWVASECKHKLPYNCKLDPYLVRFSEMISSSLLNNRSA